MQEAHIALCLAGLGKGFQKARCSCRWVPSWTGEGTRPGTWVLPEEQGAAASSKPRLPAAGSGWQHCSGLFTCFGFLCALKVRNSLQEMKEVIFSCI